MSRNRISARQALARRAPMTMFRPEAASYCHESEHRLGDLARRDPWIVAACGVVFVVAVAATIELAHAMPTGEMATPGGGSASMERMPGPGQTWPHAAATFFAEWAVMMVAMMLPSLMPALLRYRRIVSGGGVRLGALSGVVAGGYFFIWSILGIAVYALGASLAAFETRVPSVARGAPIAVGVIVLLAGALQCSTWKARQLECCREAPPRELSVSCSAGAAWRHGLTLGLRCFHCCAALMVILLVIGVMNMPLMAAVTAAITLERLAPNGVRATRAVGAAAVGGGLVLVARAAGL